MTKKHLILLLVGVVPVLAAVPALATIGSGASGTILARGISVDKVVTRGNQPYDAVTQLITIAPGGHTGWHTHPGPAVAIVKSGTLTIYEGDTALEIYVTYLDVPLGGGVRIDAEDPGNCAA